MQRTPSQALAGMLGAVLVLVGAFGFLGNGDFGTGADLQRGTFLGIDVNGWLNVLHLVSGLVLLAGSATRSATRGAWRLLLLVYLVVLVWGLIDGDSVAGLFPADGADDVLHGVLALLALLGAREAKERRDVLTRDTVPVADAGRTSVVGPGSGHVGGPRRNVARIDARLPGRTARSERS